MGNSQNTTQFSETNQSLDYQDTNVQFSFDIIPAFIKRVISNHKNITLDSKSIPFIQSNQTQANFSFQKSNKILQKYTNQKYILFIKALNQFQYPFGCIGLIVSKFKTKIKLGSGTLIQTDHVFTCAQNLIYRQNNEQAEQIQFIFIQDKQLNIRNYRKIYYPKEYISNQYYYQNFNYGVIKLKKKIQKQIFLGIKINSIEFSQDMYIIGHNKISFNQFQMHKQKLKQLKINNTRRISYNPLQNQVFNGSPILIKQGSHYKLIGLHAQSHNNQNQGILIDYTIKNNLNRWIKNIVKQIKYELGKTVDMEYLSEFIKQNDINSINLNWKYITSQDLKHLQSSNSTNLNKVLLNHNKINDIGVQYIRNSNWPNLRRLYLYDNNIGADGLKFILNQRWKLLNFLDLGYNNITGQGLKYLMRCQNKNIFTINIQKNNIDNEGIRYLCKADLPNLRILNMKTNLLNQTGAYQLFLKSNWTCLEVLDISWNNIPNEKKSFIKTMFKKIDLKL